jgi:hypothetical protein
LARRQYQSPYDPRVFVQRRQVVAMGSSGFFGGRVHNKSGSDLIVAYNDPDKPQVWRHSLLKAGDSTPMMLDVDGFRAFAPGTMITLMQIFASNIGWTSWWKIRDWTTASVADNAPGLKFFIDTGIPGKREPETKTDTDFDYSHGTTVLQPFP